MSARKVETGLAVFTLAALLVYVPLETWVSMPRGLTSPFYLVDVIAMLLMLWGAVRSLRARPKPRPAILCAAYAWAACNGWRATFGRIVEMRDGGELEYGPAEAWIVGSATLIALVIFVMLLILTVRADQ